MKTSQLIAICCLLACGVSSAAAESNPLWLRYPAISPDGRPIAFDVQGRHLRGPRVRRHGDARSPSAKRTTSLRSGATMARRSPSHRTATATSTSSSCRASGGEAQRLTFHSTREMPSTFTADDESGAVLGLPPGRWPPTRSSPSPLMTELYRVPVGRRPRVQVLPVPACSTPRSIRRGTGCIYHDIKGYESDWRKHHTSSVTRDIWVYDFTAKARTRQLTAVRRRGSQPGLRRQRRRLLLPERAERVVQRLPRVRWPIRRGRRR